MTTPQTAPAHNPHQASTRHRVVGKRIADTLAEYFDITCHVILAALEGEPQKQAIRILSWAERTTDPTYALRCWARRHGRGSYRVPREGPPWRSVDRSDRQQGYGGLRPAGCSLRAVVVDADILNRIARHMGVG
jgi:hypothetical protein